MTAPQEAALFFWLFLHDQFAISQEERRELVSSALKEVTEGYPSDIELSGLFERYNEFLRTLKESINIRRNESGSTISSNPSISRASFRPAFTTSNDFLLSRYSEVIKELQTLEGQIVERRLLPTHLSERDRLGLARTFMYNEVDIFSDPIRYASDPVVGAVDIETLTEIFTRKTGA